MKLGIVEVDDNCTHLLIKTKLAQSIALAVKGCEVSTKLGDGERLRMQWDLETSHKVADWLVPVMSPMIRDYKFVGKFEPYQHQLKICSFLTTNKRAFCLADMGTGKTASTVWALDYLFKQGVIKKALIVGVLSNMQSTWEQEFFAINPQITTGILYGSAEQRAERARDDKQVHIINHDGVEIIKDQLLANNYDVVVVDELTAYKNDKATRFKALVPIANNATYVWGLTGTPMPNKPDEVYGQIKLVNPSKLGKLSHYRFKEMVMRKVGQFNWIARFDAQQTIAEYMQPAIKIEKLAVLDLPPVAYEYVDVPMTKGQSWFYQEMRKNGFVGNDDISITAVNGGALMNKLLQVATGAIYNDEREAMKFDVTPRIDKTIEIIKEARQRSTDPSKGKTIVFAPFRHTIQMLYDELSKHFDVAVVTGDTPARERAEIFYQFQNSNNPDVILAVPRTMSHGVTATSASTIVWFGPVTSNEVYQQACNRIDRPGQTQEMRIYHLYGSTVEQKLYKVLQQRKLSQMDLLNLYLDFIKGV